MMNNLDATVTQVFEPKWDEEYQTWRVRIVYDCWGSTSTTEKWFIDREQAHSLKVGDTIIV